MLQLRIFVHQRMTAAVEEILGEVEKTINLALSEAGDNRFKRDVESPPIDCVPQEPVVLDLPSTSGATEHGGQNVSPVEDQLKGPKLVLNAGSLVVPQNNSDMDDIKWNYLLIDANGKMLEMRGEQGELLASNEIQQVVIPSPGMEIQPVSSGFSEALGENHGNEVLLNNSTVQTEEDQEASFNKRSRKGRHPCYLCGRKFRLIAALLKHIQSHGGKGKEMDCVLCGMAHNSIEELVSHMTEWHKDVDFCDICGKTFASQAYLNRHKNTHNNFKCQECSSVFRTKYKLATHAKVHNVEKPFLCDVCGKGFKRAYEINHHKKIHSEERPHLCDVCGKAFRHVQEVRNHKRIHTGERPYACTVCDKRFTLPHHLKLHMKYHSGEKPYSCDVCKKHFFRREYLKQHMVLHTGEKPYVCRVCGMGFRFPDGLRCHIKKYHAPTDQPTPDT